MVQVSATLSPSSHRAARAHAMCRVHPSLTRCPLRPSAAFSVEKGYGFISIDNENRDVFVHQSDIYAPGFRTLAEGEALEFRLTTDPKTGKVKAVDVTGPDGAYVQGAPRQAKGGEDEYY